MAGSSSTPSAPQAIKSGSGIAPAATSATVPLVGLVTAVGGVADSAGW